MPYNLIFSSKPNPNMSRFTLVNAVTAQMSTLPYNVNSTIAVATWALNSFWKANSSKPLGTKEERDRAYRTWKESAQYAIDHPDEEVPVVSREGVKPTTPPKPQLRQEQICVFNVIRDLEFSYKQPVAYQEVRKMGFSRCRLVEDRLKSVLKSLIDINYVKSTPQHRLYINYEAQNKPVQRPEIKNKGNEYVPGSGRLF